MYMMLVKIVCGYSYHPVQTPILEWCMARLVVRMDTTKTNVTMRLDYDLLKM